MRKVKFQNENYYHVFNRGVDKRDIFLDKEDYLRFLRSMRELNTLENIESLYRQDQLRRQSAEEAKPLRLASPNRSGLASFLAFCLNPNHFHFLLKQDKVDGISKFMHKLGTGYTRYFNEKYKRSGSLFQGPFKAVCAKSGAQLLYTSAYINGNPEIHKINPADTWLWSSYQDYFGKRNGTLCDKNIILKEFKNIKDYQDYTNEVINNSSKFKAEVKACSIED